MPLSSLAPSFSFFVCVFFFFSPFVFVLLFVVCCFFFVSFSFSFSFSAVAASPHRALLNPTPIFPSHESAISCAVVMKAEMQPATAADGASSNQQQPTTTNNNYYCPHGFEDWRCSSFLTSSPCHPPSSSVFFCPFPPSCTPLHICAVCCFLS